MNRKPDKDMEQPKAYKSSIDPMKTQSSVSMNTRQTQYKSNNPIDFNNKIKEYNPDNKYYKQSHWDTPKRKIIQKPKEPPAPKPKPTPKPAAPKPQRRPPPNDRRNTLQALPTANFAVKKAPPPKKQQQAQPKQQVTAQPQIAPSPEPEVQMQHWSEPDNAAPTLNEETLPPSPVVHYTFPIVAAAPARKPHNVDSDMAILPSSVGSMSRMFAMFN